MGAVKMGVSFVERVTRGPGERTSVVAAVCQLTAGRISQPRRELNDSWTTFLGAGAPSGASSAPRAASARRQTLGGGGRGTLSPFRSGASMQRRSIPSREPSSWSVGTTLPINIAGRPITIL